MYPLDAADHAVYNWPMSVQLNMIDGIPNLIHAIPKSFRTVWAQAGVIASSWQKNLMRS